MLAKLGRLKIDNLLQILATLSKSSTYRSLVMLESWRKFIKDTKLTLGQIQDLELIMGRMENESLRRLVKKKRDALN